MLHIFYGTMCESLPEKKKYLIVCTTIKYV